MQGVEPKFTSGRVSSLTGMRDDVGTCQTSVPVGPGNSGGALVAATKGTVVGVIAAKLNRNLNTDSVSYAIKSNAIHTLLKSVPATASLTTQGQGAASVNDETALIERAKAATYLVLTK